MVGTVQGPLQGYFVRFNQPALKNGSWRAAAVVTCSNAIELSLDFHREFLPGGVFQLDGCG